MTEPKYQLFTDSQLLVWTQLADHLTARIDSGEFKNSLPAHAVLAAEYGTTPTSVNRAVDDLIARGVIKPLGGRAFLYVREADGMWLQREQWRTIASNITEDDGAMSILSQGAPLAWVHGFGADVRRGSLSETSS